MQENNETKKLVEIDEEYITLYHPDLEGFSYEIEKSVCNTRLQYLWWIHRLLEKNWITKKHIQEFVGEILKEKTGNLFD